MKAKRLLIIFIFFLGINKGWGGETEDIYALSQAYHDGFYQMAISGVRAFLKKYPHSPLKEKALLIKACSYYKLKKYPQALEEFRVLINSQDKEIASQALFFSGKIYKIGKDYKKAFDYFSKIVLNYKQLPISFSAQNEIAIINYENKDYQKATSLWEKLYKDKKTSDALKEKIIYNLIKCYLETKAFDSAKKLVKELKKRNQIDYYYYQGEIQYYQGNYQKAKKNYEKILSLNIKEDKKARARLAIAWCDIKEKNFSEADEILERLVKSSLRDKDEVLFALAHSKYEQGFFEQAQSLYMKLINRYKNSSWREKAFFELFDCFYRLSKYKKAKRIATMFFNEYKDSPYYDDFHYNLGWLYYKEGDLDNALRQFQWVRHNSLDIDLKINSYCRIGDIFSDKGELDKAIETYNLVLKQYPDSLYTEYAQYHMGLELLEKKEFDSAIYSLRAVLVNFPNSNLADKIHYHLARAYFQKNDYENALDEINLLLKEYPKTKYLPKALMLKALLIYNLGRYSQALDFIEKNKEKMEDANYLHFLKAQILYSLDQLSKAEEELILLLRNVNDKELKAYINFQLAEIYYNQQLWDKALNSFKEATQISEEKLRDYAYYWQGWCYYNKGNLRQAFMNFSELFNKKSKWLYKEGAYYSALVLTQMGKEEQALQLLKQLSSLDKGRYQRLAYLKMADIYRGKNELQKALSYYEKVAERYDDLGAEADFKEAEVYEILGDTDNAIFLYLKIPSLYKTSKEWINKSRLRGARLLEKKGKIEEAKKIYLELKDEKGEEGVYAREKLEMLERKR